MLVTASVEYVGLNRKVNVAASEDILDEHSSIGFRSRRFGVETEN